MLFGSIKVGDNVQIGSHAIILPGCSIGNNVIIGAGAVVTKDIDNNTVVAGIPAKPIESICDYYDKHYVEFVHTKKMSKKEKYRFLVEKNKH